MGSGISGVADLDAGVRQAPKLGRADDQKQEKRQQKSKFHDRLPGVPACHRLAHTSGGAPLLAPTT